MIKRVMTFTIMIGEKFNKKRDFLESFRENVRIIFQMKVCGVVGISQIIGSEGLL